MINSKNNFLNFFLILLAITSFIYGFTIREDSAGGGFYDFDNTWRNQSTFNDNSLIDSLRNTKTGEIEDSINSHFPFREIYLLEEEGSLFLAKDKFSKGKKLACAGSLFIATI